MLPNEAITGYASGIQWKVTNGRMPTIMDLYKLTDDKIFEIACQVEATEKDPSKRFINAELAADAALRKCTNCNKLESVRGEFKCCTCK